MVLCLVLPRVSSVTIPGHLFETFSLLSIHRRLNTPAAQYSSDLCDSLRVIDDPLSMIKVLLPEGSERQGIICIVVYSNRIIENRHYASFEDTFVGDLENP